MLRMTGMSLVIDAISLFVEVLGWLPYRPSPDLFRVEIDYLAYVIVLVLIMACTIPDIITTVVTDCHDDFTRWCFLS